MKPGGEMTYSTCTINPLENELLVDKMLSNLSDAEILPIREGFMEKYCLPGLQVGSLTDEFVENAFADLSHQWNEIRMGSFS